MARGKFDETVNSHYRVSGLVRWLKAAVIGATLHDRYLGVKQTCKAARLIIFSNILPFFSHLCVNAHAFNKVEQLICPHLRPGCSR